MRRGGLVVLGSAACSSSEEESCSQDSAMGSLSSS